MSAPHEEFPNPSDDTSGELQTTAPLNAEEVVALVGLVGTLSELRPAGRYEIERSVEVSYSNASETAAIKAAVSLSSSGEDKEQEWRWPLTSSISLTFITGDKDEPVFVLEPNGMTFMGHELATLMHTLRHVQMNIGPHEREAKWLENIYNDILQLRQMRVDQRAEDVSTVDFLKPYADLSAEHNWKRAPKQKREIESFEGVQYFNNGTMVHVTTEAYNESALAELADPNWPQIVVMVYAADGAIYSYEEQFNGIKTLTVTGKRPALVAESAGEPDDSDFYKDTCLSEAKMTAMTEALTLALLSGTREL
jgi:hypothetical protein